MRTSIPASSTARLWLVLLLLVVLGIVYARLAQGVFQFGADPSIYIGTAKSLASGDGFRFAGRPQTQYPPAWPSLLVLVSWLTTGDYADYARFAAALFPLVLIAAFALYRTSRERQWPWLLIMLLGSTSAFITATRDVRSEILFTAATIGFLAWCLASGVARSRIAATADIAVGTLLMVMALASRSIGVSLLAACILATAHLAVRTREIPWNVMRRIAAPLLAGVVYLAWWMRWARANHTELYAGEFMNAYDRQFWLRDPHFPDAGSATIVDVFGRIPGNLTFQAAHNAELLTNIGWVSPVWTSPLVVVAALVVLAGLVDEFRRSIPVLPYYVLAYVGILSVWPFEEGTRFLVPLFPIILLFALQGWRMLKRMAERRARQTWVLTGVFSLLELSALAYKRAHSTMGLPRQDLAAVVIWLLCVALVSMIGLRDRWRQGLGSPRMIGSAYLAAYLLLGGAGIVAAARSNVRGDRSARAESLHSLSRWIGANAPTSVVIMAQPFASLELATSRHVVPFPITSNPVVLRDAVARQRPELLVVLDSEVADYFSPSEVTRRAILDSALGRPLKLRVRVAVGAIYALPDTVSVSSR